MKNLPVVIVGGGLAGLATANALIDKGIQSLILESQSIGQQKICGGFCPNQTLVILKRWGLPEVPIVHSIDFHNAKRQWSLPLELPAGIIAREIAETTLAARLEAKGGEILQGVGLKSWSKDGENRFCIILQNGEEVMTQKLVIAGGKLFQTNFPMESPYLGFMARSQAIDNSSENRLKMHFFKGGYLGIAPSPLGGYHCVGLIKKKSIEMMGGFEQLANDLEKQFPFLEGAWKQGNVPPFGIKNPVRMTNLFHVGDTVGTIPPITGNGLTLAVLGGCLAASHIQDEAAYYRTWRQSFTSSIQWGRLLHRAALSDSMMGLFFPLLANFPSLGKTLHQQVAIRLLA